VPAPNADFIAVAAGAYHGAGLKSNGSIVAWGSNIHGQCDVPRPNSDFVAVAAGLWNTLGLKSSGELVVWGSNYSGQCDVPAPNANFRAMAGGGSHCLGLKSDGTVVAWGSNSIGQGDVPEPNEEFTAVAAGAAHSVALKTGGIVVVWGSDSEGQHDVPLPNQGYGAVAAGRHYCLGLKNLEVSPVPVVGTPMTRLHPSYPNPFNPSTTIIFDLAEPGQARLSIYDLRGLLIREWIEESLGAGQHRIVWRGRDDHGRRQASGVYVCRFASGAYRETRKLTLLK
jgi:hypothetical protein